MSELPRYDPQQSYDWNFNHAPEPREVELPAWGGTWRFCGLAVASPLGIPAGPLLNGRWVLYYAGLGFDVLTYKTVRSSARACYPLPNLQPVECGQLNATRDELPAAARMGGSWAVSFGMPSKDPDFWRADVEQTRRRLPEGKVLSVSVVGTVQPEWGIDELADDYARCARWAVESGAQVIEANFSCPNVSTCDGQLYQQPESARVVARRIREFVGRVPLVIKIGQVDDDGEALAISEALSGVADALAMTNSIAARVIDAEGRPLFEGERRGICGIATREASIAQTRRFARHIQDRELQLEIIGVGGASTAEDVRRFLESGAMAVHIATAAMVDPEVGLKIRRQWQATVPAVEPTD